MAHKKAGGSSRNGRDSNPKMRGVKAFAGQIVPGGAIIVRQCGNKFWPGDNVGQGRDFTLYARIGGRLDFKERKKRRYVSVTPVD